VIRHENYHHNFFYPPLIGGVGEVVARHAMGLTALGHEVTVVTESCASRTAENISAGVAVVNFDVKGSGNLRTGYTGEIEKYQNYLLSSNLDAIVCHCLQTWSTDLAVSVFNRISAAKVLVSHGVSVNTILKFPRNLYNWLAWRPYAWRLPEILQAFDHVVFLSDKADRDRFYDRTIELQLGLKRLSTIPNGADLVCREQVGSNFRAAQCITTKYLILSISNFNPLKNQLAAIEAFAVTGNIDATLVFIGEAYNNYSQQMLDLSERLGIRARVKILQFTGSAMKDAALGCAGLYLLTSRTEVQPLVILEAMGAGVPFISFNVGCIDEIPGGVVVQNAQQMGKNICQLLANGEVLRRLGREGQQAVQDKYNWESIVGNYERLLKSL